MNFANPPFLNFRRFRVLCVGFGTGPTSNQTRGYVIVVIISARIFLNAAGGVVAGGRWLEAGARSQVGGWRQVGGYGWSGGSVVAGGWWQENGGVAGGLVWLVW